MLTVTRAFAKRNENTFANVTFSIDGATKFLIDGKELPDSSVEYLMKFALQSLQDAYAGAKTNEEAREMFNKKYEKLIEGKIGARESGESVSEEVRIGRKLMRQLLKQQNAAGYKKLLELEESEQLAKIDALLEKNAEKMSKMIADEMKRLEAERKAKALLGKELSFEL